MLQNDILCLGIAVIYDVLDFLIDLTGNLLTVRLGMCQILTDEDFIIVIVIADDTDMIRHSVTGYHTAGCLGGFLNITGCSGGNISEDDLLRNTSSQRYHDILEHTALGGEHLILFRQGHGITGGSHTGRNNGYGVDRSHIRQHMEQDRMTGFVICRDLLLLVGNNTSLHRFLL